MNLKDHFIGDRQQLRQSVIDKMKQNPLSVRAASLQIGITEWSLTGFLNGKDMKLENLLKASKWVRE